MNISNSLSRFINSIQLSHSEHIVLQTLLYPVKLNTELVYASGSAKLFMTLSPLKEQKSSRASKTPIYRLVDSYCIISLHFYFIMNGIVFVFA